MAKCRFIVLRDGHSYTTANELGRYMESKGIKFTPDSKGSRHFGSRFNEVLCSQRKKRASYGEEDIKEQFPKLITENMAGEHISHNDRIVETFLRNQMCQPSSVAVCSKGFSCRGLDLYTVEAAEKLVMYYGDKQNVLFEEGDFEFLGYVSVIPNLEYTKRLDASSNSTSQKQIISKFKGDTIDDKVGYLI